MRNDTFKVKGGGNGIKKIPDFQHSWEDSKSTPVRKLFSLRNQTQKAHR